MPFKTVIDIDYCIKPKYDTEYKNTCNNQTTYEYFFSPAEKLYWIHEYTKLTENIEEIFDETTAKEIYVNKLTVTLGITILQNQKVFIPEPTGEADVVAESKNIKNSDIKYEEITHVEVGFKKNSGLIARIIKG